jgi:hypothetical protein
MEAEFLQAVFKEVLYDLKEIKQHQVDEKKSSSKISLTVEGPGRKVRPFETTIMSC